MTRFDQNRAELIRDKIELILKILTKSFAFLHEQNKMKTVDIIWKNSIFAIEKMIKEPFNYFPDLNLFMLNYERPVGVCTLRSHDIIYSADEKKRGFACAKMIYTDIRVFEFYLFYGF